MISLIKYLLEVDSKLYEQIEETNNFISTNILSCDVLDNVKPALKNERASLKMHSYAL